MDDFLFVPKAMASALYDVAFAISVGLLLSRLWVGRLGAALAGTFRLACISLVVLLVAEGVLTTATMLGGFGPGFGGEVVSVLTGTHAGRVLLALLGIACGVLVLSMAVKGSRASDFGGLALLGAMACVRAGFGHAAARGDFTFAEVMQWLHLAATAVWGGSIMAAGWLVVPRLTGTDNASDVTWYGRRLSAYATVAVLLVILSGVYNSWRGLGGSLQPLAHTQWGWLLIAKTCLVWIAVVLGLFNRVLLGRELQLTPPDAARFAKILSAEAFVIFAIFVLSGFLANSSPAAA